MNKATQKAILATILGSVLASTSAHAISLSNGSLDVDIRADNGAIDTVLFGGSDYFNPGSPVSNYGFQAGADTGTFAVGDTMGGLASSISIDSVGVVGSAVEVVGSYLGGTTDFDFVRRYSLVPHVNVLHVETEISIPAPPIGPSITFDIDPKPTPIRLFDTFDPDQGIDQGNTFATINDVYEAFPGMSVAQATDPSGLTMILGSVDVSSIGPGGGLGISNGSELNDFVAGPIDPEGVYEDAGLHVAYDLELVPGTTVRVSWDMAFGETVEETRRDFITAVTPEPVTAVLSVMGISALAASRRRQR